MSGYRAFARATAEPALPGRWWRPLEGERAKPEGASAAGRFGGVSFASTGVAGLFGHRRVAFDAGFAQPPLVVGPQLLLLRAQEIQVVPGKNAGVVAVGKSRLHRVVAHRLEHRQVDAALAGLQHLLARPVALHFR